MRATAAQALAFRVARHHLAARADDADTAAVVGLQDTPPGTAAVAVAARAEVEPAAIGDLVMVPGVRGVRMAVARADLAIFTAGREPPDERAAGTLIGSARRKLDQMTALEALDRVTVAVAAALSGGPLVNDDLHQALRERLPKSLLLWCEVCKSHHVHASLWRATSVRGVLAIVGQEGRAAVYGTPPPAPSVADPGAELARRFLGAYGPATPSLFAGWAGIAPGHAKALWQRAGELVEVDLDGQRTWALAEDAGVLADPPRATGLRLLPNLDPLGATRDRELIAPDDDLRRRIWRSYGGPGMVLADGTLAGLWRSTKSGARLKVTVEPLRDLDQEALEEEASRLAPFRGMQALDLETAQSSSQPK